MKKYFAIVVAPAWRFAKFRLSEQLGQPWRAVTTCQKEITKIMKTEIASEVGMHAFTRAGLGQAPFRFVGMSENALKLPDGSSKAGGCCDYCFTGIRYECHVLSADGKRFRVGCDCIARVGDAGLLKAYKTSPEFRAHQRALSAAKDAKVRLEIAAIFEACSAAWAAMPHSRGFVDRQTNLPLTRLDEIKWTMDNCGASGRARNAKWLRRLATEIRPA